MDNQYGSISWRSVKLTPSLFVLLTSGGLNSFDTQQQLCIQDTLTTTKINKQIVSFLFSFKAVTIRNLQKIGEETRAVKFDIQQPNQSMSLIFKSLQIQPCKKSEILFRIYLKCALFGATRLKGQISLDRLYASKRRQIISGLTDCRQHPGM